MAFADALRAGLRGDFSAGSECDFGGDDPGGNGDDSIPHYHHDAGQRTAESGLRGDVAVADRCQGDDGPVDGMRDAVKTVHLAFHQVHDRTDDDDQAHHGEEKNDDFPAAGAQGGHQLIRFAQILREFQNAENSENAQDSNHDQVLTARQDQAQVGRQDREQIDDTVKTDGVLDRVADADKAQGVFDREKKREDPFEFIEQVIVNGVDGWNTVQHHHKNADEDTDDKEHVEPFTRGGIGFEDDFVQVKPPATERFFVDRDSV